MVINAPIADVFAFHLDTRNAAKISPPDTVVLSVDGVFPLVQGAEVRLRVRQKPLPIAQSWLVRVERIEAPIAVVDVLVKGPFAAWRHEHLFRDLGDGCTEVTDLVTYRAPLGPLGAIAEKLALNRLIGKSFEYRQQKTKELLEAAVTSNA